MTAVAQLEQATGCAPTGRARLAGVAQVIGGTLIVAGAWLPWLTLFAGLHVYRGVIGLNGKLLLAAGLCCVIGGAWVTARGNSRVGRSIGVFGFAIGAACAWLIHRMVEMARDLATTDAMVIARPGVGLFLALAGAVLVAASLALASGGRLELRR